MAEAGERHRSKASNARQKTDEAKASQAATTSQNAVLDCLLKLKAAGRINGFHVRYLSHSDTRIFAYPSSYRDDWVTWVPFPTNMMLPSLQLVPN